jgi:hypothetical protein
VDTSAVGALGDWLEIGQAIDLLEDEVIRQSGASCGRRYSRAWQQLAPEQIRQMAQPNRSHAKWLWLNRATVQNWLNTVPADRRDRWGHPLTIKIQYERAQRIAIVDPPREADAEERPRPHADPTRTRRAAAAALDEQVVRIDHSTERLRDVAGDMEMITGRRATSLTCDLSSQELAAESADNFWQVYGGLPGAQGVQWFIEALQTILDRHAAQAAAPARRRPRTTRPGQ